MNILFKRLNRRYFRFTRTTNLILLIAAFLILCHVYIFNYYGSMHLNSTVITTMDFMNVTIEQPLHPLLLGNSSFLSDPKFLIPPILHHVFIPPAERRTTLIRERWLPGVYSSTIRSLLEKHESYCYWVWFTHTANLLIRRIYSEYGNMEQQYTLFDHIRQSDAIRYAVLFHIGGVFMWTVIIKL